MTNDAAKNMILERAANLNTMNNGSTESSNIREGMSKNVNLISIFIMFERVHLTIFKKFTETFTEATNMTIDN